MKEIEEQSTDQKSLLEPRPYVSSPTIGRLFQRHGVYDGKLFNSKDKVTYTFVSNNEVISLHFDCTRRTIFYKGHNIANLTLTPEQVLHLEQFREVLGKKPETEEFMKDYSDILYTYLKERTK